MTTLKDLSRHLGLSVTQVSRALNNHKDVSQDTKKRVRDAAKLLDYHPNLVARRLVTGRSGIIAFVQSKPQNPDEAVFFMQFLTGLSASFARFDRQFILHMSDFHTDVTDVYDRLIRSNSIDGFVVSEPEIDDSRVNFLRKMNVPFVLHGQTMDAPDYPFFDIDNVAVGYDLTRHLIENGHREIAFLHGNSKTSFTHRRDTGYHKALREAGIEYQPYFIPKGEMNEDYGMLETVRLFQSNHPKPTAIIASSTRILKGVLRALSALGLSVPRDISVVVHDDLLPDVTNSDLPLEISGTESPLRLSWQPLAENLCKYLDGSVLSDVQTLQPHIFKDRGSVRAV